MDNYGVFKSGFRVLPGLNGSFVVVNDSYRDRGELGVQFGFTDVTDLMSFLNREAEAFRGQAQPSKPEFEVNTVLLSTDGKSATGAMTKPFKT